MDELLFKEESYKIIGTCIAVHKKLGAGFLDAVYKEVLEKEFKKNNIPYEKKKKLPIFYDGEPLNKHFTAEYVCYDKIIIEVKSVAQIEEQAKKEAVNYLKATHYKLGLLINFGQSSLKWKRLINTPIAV